MSDLTGLLIALAVGHLLAQLVVIIFYDKLANLDWRRRRGRRGFGRKSRRICVFAEPDDTGFLTFPDPDPSRRPTNPYTGKPVQPNP